MHAQLHQNGNLSVCSQPLEEDAQGAVRYAVSYLPRQIDFFTMN